MYTPSARTCIKAADWVKYKHTDIQIFSQTNYVNTNSKNKMV